NKVADEVLADNKVADEVLADNKVADEVLADNKVADEVLADNVLPPIKFGSEDPEDPESILHGRYTPSRP
ncbi:hypothetical protein, partial [Candidatus Bathycorpusculum sp.]|uniref:hypothetical protein n=1 Tax=Candidatus Bathycorpusculum sp. TaxID=2994959 RepID=UPI00282AD1A6|nr:hypothetical protein [Candidatus Termitimicrobium sp.]MCL2432857.1 hypothetical protein [Candidatus Termitimicrobium sp.]